MKKNELNEKLSNSDKHSLSLNEFEFEPKYVCYIFFKTNKLIHFNKSIIFSILGLDQ
jgi:hypothetical protein